MARMSKEAKAESRAKIVAEAARLLRERGIEATGVADIMEAAGLTHGGFYRHFNSKEELASEAIGWAILGIAEALEEDIEKRGARIAIERYIEKYLSPKHVASPGAGCPIAALSEEAPRGPETCRQAINDGMQRFVGLLAQGFEGDGEVVRTRATALLATLIGTVVLARNSSTKTGAKEILDAGREAVAPYLSP